MGGNSTSRLFRSMPRYARKCSFKRGKFLISRNKDKLRMIIKMTLVTSLHHRKSNSQVINPKARQWPRTSNHSPQSNRRQPNGKPKAKCSEQPCEQLESTRTAPLGQAAVGAVSGELPHRHTSRLMIGSSASGAGGSLPNSQPRGIFLYARKSTRKIK